MILMHSLTVTFKLRTILTEEVSSIYKYKHEKTHATNNKYPYKGIIEWTYFALS